ncbi:subtilase family protein [Hirsutella rhossiliensis]|uniref:Subtilase family domain-containing protein n=1 Tax=Hirsutella rhossiliensis TaxID=111463 RepID=A0A9P8SF34_9HYPO|nr:subtilase family domain-containing protein [Hirsutella rhossiliensis]KAH0958611.1 subtilase family domain-containing protein [Hirsutella rhossiliensis]
MHLSFLLVLPLALAAPSLKKRSKPAPLIVPRHANVISDRYIVKFKESCEVSVLEDAISGMSASADHIYRNMFKGFASNLDKITLSALRDHPEVEYVEMDGFSTISGLSQRDAPWGLGRISNQKPGSTVYNFDESAGQGTCAYVLDTGVDDSHQDFHGRAKQIVSFIEGQESDGNGHGTHVAGTIGSTTYGVAKKAQIFGVKVLDDKGSGPNSAIISGMEYVVKDKDQRQCPNGVVANLSLSGESSDALNQAAAALVRSGVFVGVAAGNEDEDASKFSPASEPSVCTVGGTAEDDTRYNNSNWGSAVNILAPAVDILSLRAGGGTTTMTGTSMATPHVVGLAAYLSALRGANGIMSLCRRIQRLAVQNAIEDEPEDTANLLAYNGAGRR